MSSNAVAAVAPRAPQVEVDPVVLAAIKDPATPQRFHGRVLPPASVPGDLGLRTSFQDLFGFVTRGAPYMADKSARLGEIYAGMQLRLPVVYVWNPEAAQKILRNEDGAWSTGMGWDALLLSRLISHERNTGGLLSRDFDSHRSARRLVAPAFTPKAVRGYSEIAEPAISAAVARWSKRGHVAFKVEARELMAEVANSIFTGVQDPAERARIDSALTDSWRSITALTANPLLSAKIRRARLGHAYLLQAFAALLQKRRAQPGRDMLSQVGAANGESGFDDEALVGIFINIMFAAYDTTAAAVTSLAYLLAKHPAWQERLRVEALRLPSGALDAADLQKMEEFDWAWKESLRLMPTTGYAPRRALREVDVMGHRLPAGCMVGVVLGATGRSARYWRNANEFDPERFSPARAEDKQRPGIYAPFGAGPHICIGMQLSVIEAKLLFHRLLTRCRFSLSKDYEAQHTYAPLGIVSGAVQLKLEALG